MWISHRASDNQLVDPEADKHESRCESTATHGPPAHICSNCCCSPCCCGKTGKTHLCPLRCSPEQQVRGFAACWLPVVQLAGGRLRQRHRAFIFASSVHMRVRRQVIQRRPSTCFRACPRQPIGCLLTGRLLVRVGG